MPLSYANDHRARVQLEVFVDIDINAIIVRFNFRLLLAALSVGIRRF